ncbi:tetratricopeptide repeat protein, partial [Streptomyces sp. SCA3-4]|uniref:tetratricopeptide repeat protein n=1 Tax=Streptomyces sichuanensis TaxID=2871810 RepID=UPI001CE28942
MGLMGDKARLLETRRLVAAPGDGSDQDDQDPSLSGPGETTAPDAGCATEAADLELETARRRAAESGDPASLSMLGALLLRRGDLDGAERHLRAATAEGDRSAANNLGVLLHQRGYADEAASWWRVAAVAGSAPAAHALGRYHRERGDEPAAEYWLRQSAESGHALGAYALADLLEHRSDVGAERWFRSAAERGHREAAYRLARILDGRAPRAGSAPGGLAGSLGPATGTRHVSAGGGDTSVRDLRA